VSGMRTTYATRCIMGACDRPRSVLRALDESISRSMRSKSDGRFLHREALIGKVEIGVPAFDLGPIELLTDGCEDSSNVAALAFRPLQVNSSNRRKWPEAH
jgi:hypothetical protein